MTVIRSRLGWQEEANLTQNDAISLWLLLFRPRCSPWLLVTQHLSQSHNFPQIKSAASQSPRASTALQYFRTSTPEHFGTGIYLVASLLNHSCSPNCTVVFQGRQLSIVATKDVPSGMRSGFRLLSLSGAWFVILSVWTALIGRRDDCEGCYSIYLSTSIYLHSTFYIDRFLLLRLHSQCGSHHLRQQPGRHEHAARAAEHHLALPLRLLPLCQQQVRSLIKFTVTMSHDPAPCCEV